LTNVTCDEYSGNFLDITNNSSLFLSSSQFSNIDALQSIPFIKISQVYTDDRFFTGSGISFQNIVFQSIQVKHSIFLVEDGGINTNFRWINITMRNITKEIFEQKNEQDLDYEREWIGGLCILARNIFNPDMKNSSFENINSHCIATSFSTVFLENVIFNNSGLESSPLKLSDENSISETDGVSWVIIRARGQTYRNNITSCRFIENKITPKYGGVKMIQITFLNKFILGN